MRVDVVDLNEVLNRVTILSSAQTSAYVCVSNVHMCMEVFDSNEYRNIINNADLVLPDGRPIFWSQKLLGHKKAQQVRGQDIMRVVCKSTGQKALNIGLYGGSSDELLKQVVEKLSNDYSDIRITFAYSPPFTAITLEEDDEIIKKISESNVDILFVGIGCPKQERWMAQHKGKINCVMIGVGAAFDFIAGKKKHAPRWIQKIGLEWFFRLCSEPQRLWKRYLIQNPRFIYHFLKQVLKHKISS